VQEQKLLCGLALSHAIRLEGPCSGNEPDLLTAPELQVCYFEWIHWCGLRTHE
jgi:hypothetical protein